MAKGENIFKRKDGRWEARYTKGYELSGKIKYGFCYGKTYKEAKEKVSKNKVLIACGNPCSATGPRHRFSFYCDEWLQTRKNHLKESTYVKYTTTLNRHIKPKLGACFPAAITTSLIEAFSNELLYEEELSPKTVKDSLVMLQSILKYITKQLPGILPIVDIKYPKEEKKEMRVLSRNEQARFIAYLLHEMNACKFGILLSLFTGIRIGELCALKWDAVCLKENTIRIVSTMQRLQNLEKNAQSKTKIIISPPKSASSLRTIPLTKDTAKLCARMSPHNPAAFLLTGDNSYMEPRTLQYRLEKYLTECELKGVHFHTFRHTFATRCIEVGFEIKSLSAILGHSTTSITLDRYVHASIDLKRDNMNKLVAVGF